VDRVVVGVQADVAVPGQGSGTPTRSALGRMASVIACSWRRSHALH
jgi:hypothetical protein